jgi:hypothetical protein
MIRPGRDSLERRSDDEEFAETETPDEQTVVSRNKARVVGQFELLASPFNCIYSAAKLKVSAN